MFGHLITADHKVLNEEGESRNNHRYAVVVLDLATQWIQSYLCKTKSSHETERSLLQFLEPSHRPKVERTDNSLEFGKACEDLSWTHRTSTPHRPETNGIAERAVRRVKEGTSAVLLQSGLDEKWWADSMECCCYLRNVLDPLAFAKTPNESRIGEPFKGPIIPFGAMVEYRPIFNTRSMKTSSIGQESFARNLSWICISRGRDLDRRQFDCGYRGSGKDNQCERCIDITKGRRIHIPSSRWNSKIVRKRPRTPRAHFVVGTNRKE